MISSVQFYLPLGLDYEGKTYRHGMMRLITAGDELEIQSSDDVAINSRYRDILLLCKAIEKLEESPVTADMLEELFEVDFLYLQLLYKSLNDEERSMSATCPICGHRTTVTLPALYEDMSVYREG